MNDATKPEHEIDAREPTVDEQAVTEQTATAQAEAGSAAADAASKPQKPRGRWRRRLFKLFVWLLAIAVVLRVALFFAMPWLVGLGASAVGLRAEYERLDLSLTTGELSLWHLEVRGEDDQDDEAGSPPIELEYLIVDLDVAALFGGQIRVRRVEIDGLDVRARLRADGTIDLQELFAGTDEETTTPEPEPEPPAEEAAIDPSLPLLVDAIRLQRIHAHLIDESVTPPVTRRIDVDVRISDLGSHERPCRIQTQVTSLDVIDLAAFDARVVPTGTPEAAGLEVEAAARIDGVQLGVLEPWLAPFGIRPVARELDAGADLRIVLQRPDPTALQSSLDLTVSGAHVTADGNDAVRMGQFVVRVDELTTRRATLTEARADHLRANAEQRPDGALRVAGLDLLPADPSAEPTPPPPTDPASAPPKPRPPGDEAPPFRFGLGSVTVTDGLATFVDGSVSPAARFELRLDSLTATGDAERQLGADSEFELAVEAAAPGLVETIRGDFRVTPLGVQQTLDGSLQLTGIDPQRAAAHLAAAGLESTFGSGELRARLHGEFGLRGGDGLRASIALTEFALTDEGTELLALDDVTVGPVTLTPAADAESVGRLGVETIDVRGFRLPLRRDAEGALHVAGLRTVTATQRTPRLPQSPPDAGAPVRATPDEQKPPTKPDAADPTPDAPGLRIELGRLTLREAGIRFLDESLTSPLDLQVGPLEVDVENLGLGGTPGQSEPTESQIRARLVCEQLARQLVVAGTLVSSPGPLDVRTELDLNGEGLHLEPLADLLATLQLEPRLRDGRLSGKLVAAAKQEGQALAAEAALTDLGFHDGDERLLGVDRVAVSGVRVDPEAGTSITSIDVEGPFARLARDAEGGLLAAGIRVAPTSPASDASADSDPAAADAPDAPDAPPSPPGPAAPPLSIERVSVKDARVVWSDASVTPVVDGLALVAGVELLDFSTATDAPLRFEIKTSIDDALQELAVRGQAELGAESLAATVSVEGNGLRAGPLATYLPPGLELTLQDGRLAASAEIRSGPAEEGGTGLLARLSDVSFRDGPDGDPLFALQELVMDVPRLDPDGGAVQVKSLAVRGVELDARRTDAQTLELLGLRLDAAAAPPPSDPGDATTDETATPTPAVAQAMRDGAAPAPRIVVEQVDIGVARFGFRDETAPEATPLVASIHLTNPEPLVLFDDELEELPALALRIEAGAAPVIGAATIDIVTTPFGIDPHASLDIQVEGISGNGLTSVVPDLAEILDGSGLDGGRFQAKVDVSGRVRRRGPLEFDLAAGFGVEATVRDVAFQATPDGEVLAGFEELFLDARRITPDGGVHIAQLALDRVVGRARQDKEGLHVLGLVLKTPPPADPSTAPTPAPATAPAAPPDPATVAADTPVGPPLRIDEISIHGADLVIEEETGSELTLIPIDALDLEIRDIRLNSGPPSPIRISLAVGGGKVDLPERQLSSSPIAGLVEAAGRAVLGADDEVPIEQRVLFEEIAVQGQITPGDTITGRIKTSLAGFELGALRGAAEGSGVTIGDGVLDAGIDLRLEGQKGIKVDSTFTFAHLDLSEPPGGPIQTYLKLPAPLQSVLFVLRNDRREQVIPVSFRLDSSGISAGQIASTATTALAAVIADAIVSSPFRIGGSLTDLVGLTGQEVAVDLPTFSLDFEPADASLDAQDLAVIREALDAAREDDEYALVLVHRLAAPDASKVHQLVNPPREAVQALARRLRQARDELTRARAETAAEARAHHMIGRVAEAREAVQRLQGLDREIGRLEASLDRLLERLRPGADRRADRRALEASVGLGRSRLQRVEQALRELAGDDFAERIEVRLPRSEVVEDLDSGEVQLLIRIRRES